MTHVTLSNFDFYIHASYQNTKADKHALRAAPAVRPFIDFLDVSGAASAPYNSGETRNGMTTESINYASFDISDQHALYSDMEAVRFDAVGIWGVSKNTPAPNSKTPHENKNYVRPDTEADLAPSELHDSQSLQAPLTDLGLQSTFSKLPTAAMLRATANTSTRVNPVRPDNPPQTISSPSLILTQLLGRLPVGLAAGTGSIPAKNSLSGPVYAGAIPLPRDMTANAIAPKSAALINIQNLLQGTSLQVNFHTTDDGVRLIVQLAQIKPGDIQTLRKNLKDLITEFGYENPEIVIKTSADQRQAGT